VNGWTRGADGRYRSSDPWFAGVIIRKKWVGVFAWTAWFDEGNGALCGAGHTLAECVNDIKVPGLEAK
jgi:hypothetical protein